jgi:hypothetical protein
VKWTLAAATRELPDGSATVSMKTAPVNQSLDPDAVSRVFLVICIGYLLVRCSLPGLTSVPRYRRKVA